MSLNEFQKAISIIFFNKEPLLFSFQLGFWLLKLAPGNYEERYQNAISSYRKRIKLFGFYTLIGASFFALISFIVIAEFLKTVGK